MVNPFKFVFNKIKIKIATEKAQRAVTPMMLEDIRPYVPYRTGKLDGSAKVSGKAITWTTKYAKQVYNGLNSDGVPIKKFSTAVHEKAGAHWDVRAMEDNMERWETMLTREIEKNVGK